jgi:hypothetical protein
MHEFPQTQPLSDEERYALAQKANRLRVEAQTAGIPVESLANKTVRQYVAVVYDTGELYDWLAATPPAELAHELDQAPSSYGLSTKLAEMPRVDDRPRLQVVKGGLRIS